jgi:cytochrome c553
VDLLNHPPTLIGLSRVAIAIFVIATAPLAVRADNPGGAAIYAKQCMSCHGKNGEGSKEYSRPLVGNRSLAQLTKYISRAMPEDAPGTCVGADAENVAKYIFDAFYSPAAQARIKAPRAELQRLTVNEYRNAIADVVGSTRPGRPDSPQKSGGKDKSSVAISAEEFGLRGEYSNSEKRRRTQAFTRVDPVVAFDFASKDDPDFDKLKTEELAVTWTGSVLIPETGAYEFIVKTEHSAKLWVNDMKRMLIDASVKSGNDTEFRGTVDLLGGRYYPVRLELSRGSVGVQKDKKSKDPPPKTTIALEWKQPKRAQEVIPRTQLRPIDAPTSFALAIPLPADDRSAGYERGTAVSKAWVQATSDGAIETANYVLENLPDLSGIRPETPERKLRLKEFCVKFAERAFRRPLTDEQKAMYVERQFESAKDPDAAVKRVVLLVLQSPRFLYREPAVPLAAGDNFDVASRISFGLLDSVPDAELLKAAASGKLKTHADAAREAKRLLNDPRAKAKLHAFLLSWLKVDQAAELMKDAKHFPNFTPAVASDLRTSLDLFLDDVTWSPSGDFRQFFLSGDLYLNGRLSQIYGGDLPVIAPFQKVSLKPGERFGVLTHPYMMANFSYTTTSSPIHRGVFLARNVLGVSLRQPPDAFTPLPPELHPNLNTRERITLQTSAKECKSCHGVINPLGFTLERFDAIGRFRDRENNKPIDSTGEFPTRSGDVVKFAGAGELAKFLAGSEETHEAFVARMFHALVRQPVLSYGPETLNDLRRFFTENRFDVRKLAVEIIAQTAVRPNVGQAARLP